MPGGYIVEKSCMPGGVYFGREGYAMVVYLWIRGVTMWVGYIMEKRGMPGGYIMEKRLSQRYIMQYRGKGYAGGFIMEKRVCQVVLLWRTWICQGAYNGDEGYARVVYSGANGMPCGYSILWRKRECQESYIMDNRVCQRDLLWRKAVRQ